MKKFEIIKEDLSKYSAMCFEFKCKDGDIYVKVKNGEYKCSDGSLITVPGFNGKINCPPKNVLCDQKYFWKFGLDLNNKQIDSELKIPYNYSSTISKTKSCSNATIETFYEPTEEITKASYSLAMAKYFKMFIKLTNCIFDLNSSKFNYNNHPLSICWKNKDIWKQENTYLLQNLGKNIWNTFVVTYSSSKYKKIIVASRSHIPISNENPEYTFFDKK